jgi:hypothetical protein
VSESAQQQRSLESRIDQLEKERRTWKRIGLASLLFLACIGLMGQAKQRRTPKPTPPPSAPPPSPPSAQVPKSVEAESFVLKDPNGRVRAELAMSGTGPSLKLRDESGSALVTLSLNDSAPGGPLLLLSDPHHHASFALSVLEGAGSQLSLTGERPDIQVGLRATPDGTALELSDKDGFSTTIGNGVQASKNGKTKKTSAASIALFGKDRKVLWSTP